MGIIRLTGANKSEIHIERGSFEKMPLILKNCFPPQTRFALLADEQVGGIYSHPLLTYMKNAGLSCCKYTFPGGEENKNMQTWAGILRFLAKERIGRGDCVIALGGGIVGDLAAFAAATRQRGTALVQIPTSLIAMADSCIGGKCGFDYLGEKNSIGTFYPPELVLMDPDLLRTLPKAYLADGSAELIKYGMIADEALLDKLSGSYGRADMEGILESCLNIKAKLVQEDPFDKGSRQLLNFGHTFGHLLEAQSHFTLPHGRAVAQGMVCATRLAIGLGLCDTSVLQRLQEALSANGLEPLPLPDPSTVNLAQDKKRLRDRYTFVLPVRAGKCELFTADEVTARKWLNLAFEGSEKKTDPSPNPLVQLRKGIDQVDQELLALFVRRMELCEEVGRLKQQEKLPIEDLRRETELLSARRGLVPKEYADDTEELMRFILQLSKARQRKLYHES